MALSTIRHGAFMVGASLAATATLSSAFAQQSNAPPDSYPQIVNENGIGPDPDGDSNPATNTRSFSLIGDAAEPDEEWSDRLIDFEPPPGGHGEPIRNQYKSSLGVTFGPGLTQQICKGQRYFRFDSQCTYRAAPSGKYAAAYGEYLNRPLVVNFDAPVCMASLAIYPTGGEEEEEFELTLLGWDAYGNPLGPEVVTFEWTNDVVRWRHMASIFFIEERASVLEISMRSLDDKDRQVRFLIDDLASLTENCNATMRRIARQEALQAVRDMQEEAPE